MLINIRCNVIHKGRTYRGVTIHPGVDIGVEDAPCLPGTKIIQWRNRTGCPTVFIQGITSTALSTHTYDTPWRRLIGRNFLQIR